MENIIQEIMKRLDTLARSECFEKSKNLDSYEKVKGDLFIRLMNVVKYRDELKMQFFRTVGVLHWILYARWGDWMDAVPALK